MAFDSFTIRKLTDDTIVSFEEIDVHLRKELSLRDNERDKTFGHFYFTEPEEELRGFQESISWAGLLHVIVYYSEINYGKCICYDVEAAMAWIREHAIHFPYSAIVFTSKLMKVLDDSGYYVFVQFHREKKGTDNEYVCSYNGKRILKSESGLFECNDDRLLNFYPDNRNLLDEVKVREVYSYGKSYYHPCVHSLIIPEGITSFENGFFKGGLVEEELRFPTTLKSISFDVFSGAFLPEIVIPDNVDTIDHYAFANSIIEKVVFTKKIESEYARQFKDSRIDELVIPKDMWNSDGIARNFKIHCHIGELILT